MLTVEHEFKLPKGYIDENGDLHREGEMRLATAGDELLPLGDVRVDRNPAYLFILLLSRVVNRLGSIKDITPKVVENLFVEDLEYLHRFYNDINGRGGTVLVTCPACGEGFETERAPPGE